MHSLGQHRTPGYTLSCACPPTVASAATAGGPQPHQGVAEDRARRGDWRVGPDRQPPAVHGAPRDGGHQRAPQGPRGAHRACTRPPQAGHLGVFALTPSPPARHHCHVHPTRPQLASGEVFGKNQPIALQLLGSDRSREALEGVAMELEDSLYPLLREVRSGWRAAPRARARRGVWAQITRVAAWLRARPCARGGACMWHPLCRAPTLPCDPLAAAAAAAAAACPPPPPPPTHTHTHTHTPHTPPAPRR
jgi:hypothetical protein